MFNFVTVIDKMKFLFIVLLNFPFLWSSFVPKLQEGCDYESDITTYFCRNVVDVFPNQFYGNYHLRCVNCDIRVFSNATFPYKNNSLLSFNVSESNIKFITTKAFGNLKHSQYIYLQNNEINEIAAGAFWGLRQVYELHLENNQIISLMPGFLEELEANTIDLSNNSLRELSYGTFSGSLGVLSLDLSRNQIGKINQDAFLGLQDLEVLNLSDNRICHLPFGVFKHLTVLRQLYLADNNLRKFVLGTFSGLKNLQSLVLANNSIESLNGDFLLPLYHLNKLDISSNGIYYFDANLIHLNSPTLTVIKMDDNLFSCSVLMNIIQYFKGIRVEVVNTIGRYSVQNVNGIACVDIPISEGIDFGHFLKLATEETKNYVNYC